MALLTVDSFDHYTTITHKSWSLNGGGTYTGTISAGNGRNSTDSMRITTVGTSTASYVTKALSSSGATAIVGVAWKVAALPGTNHEILQILESGSVQVGLEITSSGALRVYRSTSGTTLITTAGIISAGVWYFLELKVTIANSGGTAEIKVDGVSEGSFSGDTQNTGNATWSSISLGQRTGTNLTHTQDFDDLYVCDGSGGVEDDFLGDHRIVAVVASSGDGSNTDWSLSTGSDHGALVDENPPNTTDYVLSGTSGQRDTYNFAAVGVTGTVKAVQTLRFIKAEVAGVRSVAPVVRISSTNYDGTTQAVGSDWIYQHEIYRVSPATSSAWTISEIDGAEFGAKVTA